MATLEYNLSISSNSSTYSYSDATANVTGYRTTIVITTNKNCTCRVQYSDNGSDWDDHDEFAVNTGTETETYRLSKYIRVGAINDVSGETDTVTVVITAVTESPQYCSAVDVAAYLGWTDSAVATPETITRYEFSSSTIPSLAEVNDMILAAEDMIDSKTGHAWRERTVTDEIHDYENALYTAPKEAERDCRGIKLSHRKIRSLTSGTDEINVWNGSSYTEYVADKTEGRNDDFWVDSQKGILYFKDSTPSRVVQSVKVTYRYGDSSVPDDVRELTALMAARRIMMSHDHIKSIPQGDGAASIYREKLIAWKEIIDQHLKNLQEAKWVI